MQTGLQRQHLSVGTISGFALAALCLVYAIVLIAGLLSLPAPEQAIRDPWFTAMEVLILAIAPAMVGLTVGLYAWAEARKKQFAMLSVVFMSMCAVVTCSVHFVVLTLSRHPAFASADWSGLLFSFTWPSLAYTLDILAWDLFFPLAAFFAGLAVHGAGLARLARVLLFLSAALAFVGLAGVPLASMNVRNIGIVGYVILFPIAATLLAVLFRRPEGR